MVLSDSESEKLLLHSKRISKATQSKNTVFLTWFKLFCAVVPAAWLLFLEGSSRTKSDYFEKFSKNLPK
jgi:hypothetical protein